jgi:MFS family permease
MLKHLRTFFSSQKILADGFVFFYNAILFGFWVTRLPEIKTRLDLSEGELGFALFFAPIGSILATWLSGPINNRLGEGRVTVLACIGFCLYMVLPVSAPTYFTLILSLMGMGFLFASMDVAMNAIATRLEQESGDNIMSVFHGFFSLGGMFGALAGGWIIGAGISIQTQMLVFGVAGALIAATWVAKQLWSIRSEPSEDNPHLFRLPSREVLGLALIALCTMVGEGSVGDWSAIYLRDVVAADPVMLGWGFAAFSATMTTGRFLGDYIIHRLGRQRVVQASSVLAAAGAALVIVAQPAWAIAGFTLIGLGYACMVPVVFSRAGSLPGVKPAEGIGMVAGLGYFGFLAGPVLFGFIADVTGLRISWFLLILLSVLSFSLAKKAA